MICIKYKTIMAMLTISILLITPTPLQGNGSIMMHENLQAIILAAGKSTRFGTGSSKLLAPLCGQPIIVYPARLFHDAGIDITVVTGHQKEDVESTLTAYITDNMHFIHQMEQRGTGHALLCTKEVWNKDYILIMNGDMPLVSNDTIIQLYSIHTQNNATISFVTAPNNDPAFASYGRIIQDEHSIKIVEASDFTGPIPSEYPVNAGIYLISKDFLLTYCDTLEQNNKSHEFYITDLIGIASNAGKTVCTMHVSCDDIRGVNTLQELVLAEGIKRAQLINSFMKHGVRFMMPQNTVIDLNVAIGKATVIGAGVHLLGNTQIGEHCTIAPYSILNNAVIEDNVIIEGHSVISDSTVHAYAHIGPYAHLRLNTEIHERVHVGNFVEIKKSTLGADTKAKHLSYLGDATIGTNVNIGAGTITCNHDGKNKHATIINDNAYIGSNNTLVAPLTIEASAFTAAGSTITENVPKDALAIGRARQVIKEGYARKLRGSLASTTASPEPADPVVEYTCAQPAATDAAIPEEL